LGTQINCDVAKSAKKTCRRIRKGSNKMHAALFCNLNLVKKLKWESYISF